LDFVFVIQLGKGHRLLKIGGYAKLHLLVLLVLALLGAVPFFFFNNFLLRMATGK
jgi:hypothetical protein